MAENQNNNSFITSLIGEDGIKFNISIDFSSLLYLMSGAVAVGILLILFSKAIKK